MKIYKTIPCFFLMAALCGCTTQSIEDAKNIVETKTYAYRYEYETEQNGEAIHSITKKNRQIQITLKIQKKIFYICKVKQACLSL